MVYKDALVYADKSFHQDLDVLVENGRILLLGTDLPGDAVSLRGTILLPGLIDIHTHGFHGLSYGDGEQSLRAIARMLPKTGVTSVVPAISGAKESFPTAMKGIAAVHDQPQQGEARVLGAHFEGPFIATTNLGAMLKENSIPISMDDFTMMAAGREDLVRIVALSPELPNALEFVEALAEKGICVSAAHTGATYEQAMEAFKYGLNHVTHLFNAMNPLLHRAPGVPGAALVSDATVELICDGVHLHDGILKLVERCKKPEQVCLITDSSPVAGLPDGEYDFGGHTIVLKEGTARIKGLGNLAGSALTMDAALRHMLWHTNYSASAIIDMATAVPAREAGLEKRGSVASEYFADFVIVNREYYPLATVVEGVPVWQADGFHTLDSFIN